MLATSREPLHVPGEVTFRVPSLELPEPADASDPDGLANLASVRLFLDRAYDVRPGFILDVGNAASIVEICRRLDGIPLVLELDAARMSHLEPAEIGERLGEVPDETPAVPLAQDLARLQKSLRMKPSAESKLLDLDLRNETDLSRSHMLHRLTMLGVDTFVQNLFYGGALVLAVAASQLVRKRQPLEFS